MSAQELQSERVIQERVRPVVFGIAVAQIPPAVNRFENGPWTFERVGLLWRFGIVSDTVAGSFVLHDITAEWRGSA